MGATIRRTRLARAWVNLSVRDSFGNVAQSAEGAASRALGLGFGHATAAVGLGLHLELEAKFLLQLVVQCVVAENRGEPQEECAHGRSGPGFQKALDGAGDALPLDALLVKLFAAGAGQGVEARPALIVGDALVGPHPAALFEAEHCGVERALVELQDVFGNLLYALRDAIAVHGAHHVKGLQDEKVEGALENIGFFVHLDVYRSLNAGSCRLSNGGFPNRAHVVAVK
jgi:hypothetical protein